MSAWFSEKFAEPGTFSFTFPTSRSAVGGETPRGASAYRRPGLGALRTIRSGIAIAIPALLGSGLAAESCLRSRVAEAPRSKSTSRMMNPSPQIGTSIYSDCQRRRYSAFRGSTRST